MNSLTFKKLQEKLGSRLPLPEYLINWLITRYQITTNIDLYRKCQALDNTRNPSRKPAERMNGIGPKKAAELDRYIETMGLPPLTEYKKTTEDFDRMSEEQSL